MITYIIAMIFILITFMTRFERMNIFNKSLISPFYVMSYMFVSADIVIIIK